MLKHRTACAGNTRADYEDKLECMRLRERLGANKVASREKAATSNENWIRCHFREIPGGYMHSPGPSTLTSHRQAQPTSTAAADDPKRIPKGSASA